MLPPLTLALTQAMHAQLRRHLFCGDGRESAAIMLCSRVPLPRRRLLAKHVILVPNAECKRRSSDQITWPGEYLEQAIDLADSGMLTMILIHSHPGNQLDFSPVDDCSDREVLPSLFQAVDTFHGTAIMVPDGTVRARLYDKNMACEAVDLVSVAGDDLLYWWADASTNSARYRPIAFTSDMTDELHRLTAVIIGVSGTGSPVAEQLGRLGFGRIIMIDPDRVEKRNLNRIINSSLKDADGGVFKVNMFAAAIARFRESGVVHPVPTSLATRGAVLAASQGDVIFCCTDTVEARYLTDLICSTFLIPLFDVGVVIPTKQVDGRAQIIEAYGRVDYVQPGGTSLLDRGVYTPASLEAEYLKGAAPEALRDRIDAGYLPGANEEAPAVISLNMRAASICLSEFINRAYPFGEPNCGYARVSFTVGAREQDYDSEGSFQKKAMMPIAHGDAEPLLGLPSLKAPRIRKLT
jgi:hypothetical protein